MTLTEIQALLEKVGQEERGEVLRLLRGRYRIVLHPLEARWNTTAEAILEAIDKSADLTQRGIRGVLAEATFRTVVLPKTLARWRELPVAGNAAFDLELADDIGPVRVQVKLQRKEQGVVKYHRGDKDYYVVETQRTRGGKRRDLEQSRPYRVDEFDVLAVCLHPATNEWTSFTYCAADDLKVRASDSKLLDIMQPIPVSGSDEWSQDFENAVRRFRRSRRSGRPTV